MLLWATLAVLFVAGASKPEVCEKSPTWNANGLPVMENLRGNVTLVAFLTASESFCQQQAERLEELLEELYSEGVTNITFLIINLNSPLAELMVEDLEEKVSFLVYQDNSHDNIWKNLEAGNKDIYIYDKCGRLTYNIPFPFSILHPSQPIVSAALRSTYFEQLCGEFCNSNIESNEIISDYNRSINHNYLKINDNENITDILTKVEVQEKLKNKNDKHQILVEDVSDEFINVLNNTNVTSDFNITDTIDKKSETENLKDVYNDVPLNITIEIPKEELNVASVEVNITTVLSLCEREYNEICPFWSKNRLKHIKNCCKLKENALSHPNDKHESFKCRHVGKKRCKKMQPVIKCCLGPDFSNEPDILNTNTTLLVTNGTNTNFATKQPKEKSFMEKIRN